MAQNDRHQEILRLVRNQGFVSVESLVENFGVTPQTIRRDINTLCEDGLVRRYHGGAALPSNAENLAYDSRKTLHHEDKQRIAEMVSDYIPDHASLFINLGTTTEEVAKKLCDHEGLRVITNNLNVAAIMGRVEGFEVMLAGGIVRARDLGLTGQATIDFISQFKVDYGIIGISSIEEDGTLRDYDCREVRVTETIMRHSREVLLVADHTKFGRDALVRLGKLSHVHILFTDLEPPAEMAEVLSEAGTIVKVPDIKDIAISS